MSTERRIARLMDQDQTRLVKLGKATAVKVIAPGLSMAVRHFRTGRNPIPATLEALDKLVNLLTDVMVAGHLAGLRRAAQQAPVRLSFKQTVTFLRKRAALSTDEVARITTQYDTEAARVISKVRTVTEQVLQKTMTVITEQGLHVKEGVEMLRAGYITAGLVSKADHLLETVFRTQTQIAYSAGRWDQEQSPEIQEILWGYTYTTVGDDRVREEHAGFDGVTLPKDDSFWSVNFPPNGWNCRCVAIAVYEKRETVQPKVVDGVVPTAAEGFNFHPGEVFRAIK